MNVATIERQLNSVENTTNVSIAPQPTVFTNIYRNNINIAVWQRNLSSELTHEIETFLSDNPTFRKSISLSPETVREELDLATQRKLPKALVENIAQLVDMFCCLFDLKEVGLRLTALNNAMCPRFHVDHIPCRLVSTFHGNASQWLPNDKVDRTKLGHGNNGLPDETSGLYKQHSDIEQLSTGDVALLKGEAWAGNENLGIVHRSPATLPNETRLLMTLDFC
ncbi:succinylglutamate desuccinylase [Photobacterium angustum]|uniref:DUF1826 domain-containing protein n=1 Tax=Photobacterium angustum TaxID=661 RepID=UPI0005DB3E5E|nr:DUF1826 domain-containing protein [Photobacterium angustum]KJG06396.1 succinylglutamate desuccinylase [Photobacterium angustum]PSV94184.1 DUF1826 domain-containing protein [Photobacterium angustum]